MRERLDVERDPPSREGSSQQTVSLITPRLISVEAWQSLKDTYDDSSSVSSKIRIFFALLSFFSPSSFSFPTLSTLSSVFFPFFLFALPSPLFLCQPRRREMKGGEGESFSATLLRSLTREQEKKKKKNISNERNPLFAARQEFEEHDGFRTTIHGGVEIAVTWRSTSRGTLFLGENWDWQE